jgi:hypothetical protein
MQSIAARMQCDICFRTGGSKLPFLCPTDARNVLYVPRLENARVLIEKDVLDQQVSAITSRNAEAKHPQIALEPPHQVIKSRWDVERAQSETYLCDERTQRIIMQAEELRAKIESARADLAGRKAMIARRRSELASATNGLETRRFRQIESVDKKIKMRTYEWNKMHRETAVARAFLCGEAAKLYGLRRLKERDVGQDEYSIAGIPIVDLWTMNSASAAQITTCLSSIAHLLVLSTHYLSIRLPAEITLPHRDYPLPTVLSLSSSYTYSNLPFPGSTPVHSSSNSPSASRHIEPVNLPRPRPLFITKPLPLLAKEDPSAYSLFIEGATLLAYDVAWVCKSQGIPVGTSSPTSFDDICALGRNLFNLLIGTSPRPNPASRVPSSTSTATTTAASTPTKTKFKLLDPSESPGEDSKKTHKDFNTGIGHFSHGTAHTFLGSPEGNEFVRGFKLLSPLKLADRLKAQLLSEVTSAEWEIVDQEAWAADDGKELEDDGVMVGARRESEERPGRLLGGGLGRFGGAMQSFMSMRTVMDAVEIVGGVEGSRDRKPGTSGWTKVKPR